MTVLRELIARIKLDTRQATSNLKKYDRALDDVAKKAGAVAKGAKKVADETEKAGDKTEKAGRKKKKTWKEIGKAIQEAAKKAKEASADIGEGITKVGGAVVGAATGVFTFTSEWAKTTAEIDNTAGKLNAGVEGFQELTFVAKNFGSEASNVEDVLKEIQVRSAEAALTGMGPFAEASEVLGLNFVKIAEMSPVDAFVELRRELSKVEDTTKRAFLAEELLGEQGVELGNIINLTEKDFAALRQEARDLGVVLGKDALDAASDFNDQMTRAKADTQAFANDVAKELVPTIADLIKEYREWNREDGLAARGELAKTMGETAKAGASLIKVFGQVLSLVNDVNEATGGLDQTLKALAGTAVAIKLATFGPVGIAAAALLGVGVGADILNEKRRRVAKAEDKLAGATLTAEERAQLSQTPEGRLIIKRFDDAQKTLDRTGTSLSAFETRRTETVDEFSGAEEDTMRLDAEAAKADRDRALVEKQAAMDSIRLGKELAAEEKKLAETERRLAEAQRVADEPVFGIAGTDLDPDFVEKQRRRAARELKRRQGKIAALRKKIQDAGKDTKKDKESPLTFGELLGFGKGGAEVNTGEGRGLGTTIINQTFNIGVPAIKLEIGAAPGSTVASQAKAVASELSNLGPELLKRTQRAAVGALS